MSSTNWIQHAGNTMPTVNSDNTLTFNGGVNEYIADSYLLDSTQDFEITVEFDNNTTSSGTHDFAMFLIGEPMGSNPPLMILRQQGYNAWGANNSFFFGLYDGSSSYTSSGAGPAQLASGAMRIKKTGSLYEFFSSSDKVAFTKMGEINAAGQPFDSVDPLKVVIKTGSRTTEVSGYSNSQQPTPETTLVAHYTFDDLTDGAGSYDLTAFDGASVSGGVMTFPNTTGGMKPSSKIPLASEFTVSLWFKNLKDRSLAQANFLMFTGNRGTVNDYLFCIYHNDELAAFKGGMISSGYSMTHLTHSGWHHLVAAYDNGTLTFYVDGAQAGNSISYANSGEIELFGSFDGAYEYAPADEMDDIRVYSMALDATQVSTLYTETTVSEEQGSGSSYDWTHSGQLTNIVKFVRGQDLNGNPSYAYAKKEDDNTTTLYFTPDLTNFAAFNSYDSGASSIDGSPIFIEYGAGGKVLVGTDTGKVYQIELDEYSVPQSYALLHDVVGGHPINSLKYGYAMNQWIFEAGGDIYTIPAAGGGAVLRHSLPAGAKVVDFAEGDEGKVAFIVRMADFSIEPRMAPADWSVIYGPSSMVADASVATDFNYSHAMDLWVSSNADGSSIVTVSDLLDYLS